MSDPSATSSLFRHQAARRQDDVFASVCVLTPASLWSAVLSAALVLLALATAARVIELPERIRAVGVLMPEGGIVRIRSPAAAIVSDLLVGQGSRVRSGQTVAILDRDTSAASISSVAESRRARVAEQIRLRLGVQAERARLNRLQLSANERLIGQLERDVERAYRQQDLLKELMDLAAGRAGRLQTLADRGLLANDTADAAAVNALMARERRLAAQADVDHLHDRLVAARAAREELVAEGALHRLEASAAVLQLDGERMEQQADTAPIVKAPIDGYVLRLDVAAGDAVPAGGPVMSLAGSSGATQAWLYVSTRDAALLEPGQTVSLRFDALPHQHYGVASARIVTVGELAVGAAELPPTVRLAEPAFEIRAELDAASMDRFVSTKLPGFGVSFRADVVKGRRRLMDWALDRLRAAPGGDA